MITAFRDRDLSITAWSFARREVRDDELLDAISSEAIKRLSSLQTGSQELANLAWAVAPLDLRHRPLLDAIASAAIALQSEQFTAQELANMPWSYASLKYRHEPLMQSLASESISRISQVTTQNLVNTAWALDVLDWLDPSGQELPGIFARFLQACSGSLGVEWVMLAAIADERGFAHRIPVFAAEFQARVLSPALAHLGALRSAPDDCQLATNLQRLQDWVVQLQVPHLGPVRTRAALIACSALCADPTQAQGTATWVAQAQEAVAQAVWWSCPHAAVSSQGVAAWVAARLEVAGGGLVEELGRVFLADDSAEHSILVERMLQPIFLQVPRSGHAERRALIALLRAVSRAFDYDNNERWGATAGWVRLYASHYPCISCLAVVAQFTRRMPVVALQVEFDNAWVTWEARSVPPGEEVLTMGRSV